MLIRAFLLLSISIFSSPSFADCYDDAGAYHGVNPWILRAISARESGGNANAINRNSNGTVDIGWTQTNSTHLPELAKHGVSQSDLFDPCKSVYVAAWLLQKKVKRWGNSCFAVGAYHSETPARRDAYIRHIQKILLGWGIPWKC